MLCEGPTHKIINTRQFLEARKQFFKTYYDLEIDEAELKQEFKKLDNADETYDEIVLWFEYDLFCHINLLAVISLLHQLDIHLPLFLVCSGRVQNEKGLKALTELTKEQLLAHYEARIQLNEKDIALARSLWQVYNGKDPNLFIDYLPITSSFTYLSNCLIAHLERFPDQMTGLSTLERNTLELIQTHTIKSKHQLLGYMLNYQGYYGYSDLQLKRLIDVLSPLYQMNEEGCIALSRKGHEALLGLHNFAQEINNTMMYGGVESIAYMYNHTEKRLIKTPRNVN